MVLSAHLLVTLVAGKIGEICTWVGIFIESLIVLEWFQIDEVLADIIQHRLTFCQDVLITPARFVVQERPEFRYLMYQTEG
jgi:hypothetical protein